MTVSATSNGLELRPNVKQQPPEPDFPEEREGWKGYIEWEKYPEKKEKAAEILAQYKFPHVGLLLSGAVVFRMCFKDRHTYRIHSHLNSSWAGIASSKVTQSSLVNDGSNTTPHWGHP